ncbi:hypothetical protein R6Q59_035922 [Mikania micrantha]
MALNFKSQLHLCLILRLAALHFLHVPQEILLNTLGSHGVQNVVNDLVEDLDVVHNNYSSNSVLCIDLSQYFQTRSTHVSNNEAASEVIPPTVVVDEDEMFQGEFDYDEDDPDYNTEGSETSTEDYGGESD